MDPSFSASWPAVAEQQVMSPSAPEVMTAMASGPQALGNARGMEGDWTAASGLQGTVSTSNGLQQAPQDSLDDPAVSVRVEGSGQSVRTGLLWHNATSCSTPSRIYPSSPRHHTSATPIASYRTKSSTRTTSRRATSRLWHGRSRLGRALTHGEPEGAEQRLCQRTWGYRWKWTTSSPGSLSRGDLVVQQLERAGLLGRAGQLSGQGLALPDYLHSFQVKDLLPD